MSFGDRDINGMGMDAVRMDNVMEAAQGLQTDDCTANAISSSHFCWMLLLCGSSFVMVSGRKCS